MHGNNKCQRPKTAIIPSGEVLCLPFLKQPTNPIEHDFVDLSQYYVSAGRTTWTLGLQRKMPYKPATKNKKLVWKKFTEIQRKWQFCVINKYDIFQHSGARLSEKCCTNTQTIPKLISSIHENCKSCYRWPWKRTCRKGRALAAKGINPLPRRDWITE